MNFAVSDASSDGDGDPGDSSHFPFTRAMALRLAASRIPNRLWQYENQDFAPIFCFCLKTSSKLSDVLPHTDRCSCAALP